MINGLDYLYLMTKKEQGEELTQEEISLIEEWQKEEKIRLDAKQRYIDEQPKREAANREYAIKELMSKYCPIIKKNCSYFGIFIFLFI